MQAQAQTQPKRTRAAVLRERVVVRLAVNEAGPAIAQLLKENGIDFPGADWSQVFPNWLIACDGDEVIGCLLMLPAKPVSFFEFLHVKPSAGFKLRAIAIRKLVLQAIATGYHNGSCLVGCVVSEQNKAFANVLDKINCVPLCKADVRVKRLRDH